MTPDEKTRYAADWAKRLSATLDEMMVTVAVEAAHAEREACAQAADAWDRPFADVDAFEAAAEIAAAIRARV